MLRSWGRRYAHAVGLAAAFGLMLTSGGEAVATPKPGGKEAAPATKAIPKHDDRDDDLEGVPRHIISKSDEGWVLVNDDYLKVGTSVRIRMVTLGAPIKEAPRGLILESNVQISCKTLSTRRLDQTVYSTDLRSRNYDGEMRGWEPLALDAPLLPVARAFCNGRPLDRGHAPIAPLDTLYALAFDAPYARHLIDVNQDTALLIDVRITDKGRRPQATLQTILRRPDGETAFVTLTGEFDCARQTYRVHRLIARREDGSVIGTSGAEAGWEPVNSGPLKKAADAACNGTFPDGADVIEASLGQVRAALMQGPWR